jgi:hypothetical protein
LGRLAVAVRMKFRLTRTQLASGTEYVLEVERGISSQDKVTCAERDAERYRMAVEAIFRAPDSAAEIAGSALEE